VKSIVLYVFTIASIFLISLMIGVTDIDTPPLGGLLNLRVSYPSAGMMRLREVDISIYVWLMHLIVLIITNMIYQWVQKIHFHFVKEINLTVYSSRDKESLYDSLSVDGFWVLMYSIDSERKWFSIFNIICVIPTTICLVRLKPPTFVFYVLLTVNCKSV